MRGRRRVEERSRDGIHLTLTAPPGGDEDDHVLRTAGSHGPGRGRLRIGRGFDQYDETVAHGVTLEHAGRTSGGTPANAHAILAPSNA